MSEILFADDDAAMREMVATVLAAAGHGVRLADDGSAALAEVRRHPPDLVILDYRMGTPDGFTVCREIKSTLRLESLPVMILTARTTPDQKLRGFAAGADDYLPKPFDARELVARVGALLRLTQAGREQNPTSGLPGGDAIEREYARRARDGAVTVCYLDLDHFKPFADRFGFALADQVIRDVRDSLRQVTAETDFVGHIGGDDFVVLCDADRAVPLVERAQAALHGRLAPRLPAEVAASGVFWGVERDGVERVVPLTQLSAAILQLRGPHLPPFSELSGPIAALKHEAKQAGTGGIAVGRWPGPGS